MITAELDRALASALRSVGAGLPFTAGTWRPAPGGSYATALALELAGPAGCSPHDLAAALAAPLAALPWITGARPSGTGYLTIDVTPQAVAESAAAMAAAGPACAVSTILAGTEVVAVRPWPDLAAEPGWPRAWQAQAEAMTSRLAAAAGARVTTSSDRERGRPAADARTRGGPGRLAGGAVTARDPGRPAEVVTGPAAGIAAAVAYFGPGAVRYWLARTLPGGTVVLAAEPGQYGADPFRADPFRADPFRADPFRADPFRADPFRADPFRADPFRAVQLAHAEAASTLRWAADLGIERAVPAERLAALLADPAERALLGLLSFLPVRVAAAARRRRPAGLPRYLEQVGEAWLECRRRSPALPFGGRGAAREPAVASARLMLADAARAVLAAGLGLTGCAAPDRI